MKYPYFSKNGKLLPVSTATISLDSIEFQYGFGVYETLKVRNGILYFAKEHVNRLLESAKIITLGHSFSAENIIAFIKALIVKNTIESCNIKILLIGSKIPEDSLLIILPLAPLFPDRKLYSNGVSVETVHYERFLPNAKTLNMLPSYLFYMKASKNGHYDALYVNSNDCILEGTRTNFFGLQGTALITPPKECVLDGVTRQTVIAVAKKNGFSIKEEKIPLNKIASLDGAFLTSTSSKIIPIRQIDLFQLAIPAKLKDLMQMYDAFLQASKGIFTSS